MIGKLRLCKECHDQHPCTRSYHQVFYGSCDVCNKEDFVILCDKP